MQKCSTSIAGFIKMHTHINIKPNLKGRIEHETQVGLSKQDINQLQVIKSSCTLPEPEVFQATVC